jgi:hypothetical protein
LHRWGPPLGRPGGGFFMSGVWRAVAGWRLHRKKITLDINGLILASKLIKALISFDLPGNHNLLVGGSNPSAATI